MHRINNRIIAIKMVNVMLWNENTVRETELQIRVYKSTPVIQNIMAYEGETQN